jgi:hypothetical protein
MSSNESINGSPISVERTAGHAPMLISGNKAGEIIVVNCKGECEVYTLFSMLGFLLFLDDCYRRPTVVTAASLFSPPHYSHHVSSLTLLSTHHTRLAKNYELVGGAVLCEELRAHGD